MPAVAAGLALSDEALKWRCGRKSGPTGWRFLTPNIVLVIRTIEKLSDCSSGERENNEIQTQSKCIAYCKPTQARTWVNYLSGCTEAAWERYEQGTEQTA